MTSATAPAKPGKPLKIDSVMSARRPPEQARATRALHWRELFTSLWAPITLLGVFFIPYVVLIEFKPEAVGWALPVMQYLSLALLAYLLGLVAFRLLSRR